MFFQIDHLKRSQMVHILDVHLTSYARFQIKEMLENFDRETEEII